MRAFQLASPAAERQQGPDIQLAASLRRLACEVERGTLSQVIVTAIYSDGRIERLGGTPTDAEPM